MALRRPTDRLKRAHGDGSSVDSRRSRPPQGAGDVLDASHATAGGTEDVGAGGTGGASGTDSLAAADALRARYAGARVLLVEDHPLSQLVTSHLLQIAGLSVEVAGTGALAIQRVFAEAFDLILMDVQMPGIDGLEATRRLRAEPRFAALPIIAMTAGADDADRHACFAAGMNDHLVKPVDPAALYATLARWLHRGAAPVAAPARTPDRPESEKTALRCAGVSTVRGLRFFGDDRVTYRTALAHFADMYAAGIPGGHGAGADTSARTRLRREAHSIAGAAAAIGAVDLQREAMRLDALLQGPAERVAPDAGASLDAALRGLAASLREALGARNR